MVQDTVQPYTAIPTDIMPRKLKLGIKATARKDPQWTGLTELHAAVLTGSEDGFRSLKERKWSLLETKDKRGRTALHWAATTGTEEIVSFLFDRNADVKTKDSIFGQTPLHWAAKYGRYQVITQFLHKDVGILDIKDPHGATALHYAAENGHEAVVKLLLESGADLNIQDQNERTPNGAQVDRKDGLGRTTLSLIAMGGLEDLITIVVEKGADINSPDSNGWTPLWRASLNGSERMLQLLIEKGADTEAQDSHVSTPLIWAAKNGCEQMVVLLLRAGADPKFQDRFGRTPLSWASTNGFESIVQQLMGITQVFGDVKTSIAQLDLVQLCDVMKTLDKSHDDLALEWLFELLWPSHISSKVRLGEELTMKAVLSGGADDAVSLALEIAKHSERSRGIFNVDTLEISIFVSRLSTTAGRRVQFQTPHKAEEFYLYAAGIHETILNSFVRDAVNAKESRSKSTAAERYVDVPTHFYLLKLAVERLGWWPRGYSIYKRLNANLFQNFIDYLIDFEGVERWNLKKFGSGRAEADDDLLDLDHIKLVQKLP
ncbi:ankyrin repeat domain protein, putative [Talaromyces marneffei ATCC 18224]|uniref:Ankyrin repeat domain protein, putative n=1 Tax=Talaromyces marneffei (strain ATCC 18224 / CBS 334.59 / QM 7333) TaxID=441960 RepID=B6QF98_TALMQ|nr:ankyrin repeat domain protein, putative [Talaromyces marneffei ATCC 18224]